MLRLLAIVLSFNACHNLFPIYQLPTSKVFACSFTLRNFARPTSSSCTSFLVCDTFRKHGRYAESVPRKRQPLYTNGAGSFHRGFVTILAASFSSSQKTPAPTDWVVVEEYPMISPEGIDPYLILGKNHTHSDSYETNESIDEATRKYKDALVRLNVTRSNLTLPIALMSLDPSRFPSLSNARKACRQGKIAFRSLATSSSSPSSSSPSVRRGTVGDRVYPLDWIIRRELHKNLQPASNDSKSNTAYDTHGENFVKSKFQNLEVAYEDDFMAVIVKPAGLLVHPQGKNGDWGRKNNVLNALPYFLRRPIDTSRKYNNVDNSETLADQSQVLNRPVPVHRLDFATSGLLVAAKTRGASRLLAQEFEYRKARKTYTAMVYGIPSTSDNESSTIPSFWGPEDSDRDDTSDGDETVSTGGAENVKVRNELLEDGLRSGEYDLEGEIAGYGFNFADCFLDNKRAKTYWRLLGSYNCSLPIRYQNDSGGEMDNAIHSINVPVSIVEMKPKTGRYHQLRRTMAWLYKTPIIGDPVYSQNYVEENFLPENAEFVEQQTVKDYSASLMLCSNEIDIAHPYYNTPAGKIDWREAIKSTQGAEKTEAKSPLSSSSSLYESEDGTVRVSAAIQLPKKFSKFIAMMERKKQNDMS